MKREDEGMDCLREIAAHVRKGGMAYLRQQYKVVTIIFVVLALFCHPAFGVDGVQNPYVLLAFITGLSFSGLVRLFRHENGKLRFVPN